VFLFEFGGIGRFGRNHKLDFIEEIVLRELNYLTFYNTKAMVNTLVIINKQSTTQAHQIHLPPSLFSHSAMGLQNLKKFRHIQFFTPDSPVIAEFKYSLSFGDI
jgi:hypothetical protein